MEVCAGSYSYVPPGASARTYDELALPVRRRLMFAGEHTCKVGKLLACTGSVWTSPACMLKRVTTIDPASSCCR